MSFFKRRSDEHVPTKPVPSKRLTTAVRGGIADPRVAKHLQTVGHGRNAIDVERCTDPEKSSGCKPHGEGEVDGAHRGRRKYQSAAVCGVCEVLGRERGDAGS